MTAVEMGKIHEVFGAVSNICRWYGRPYWKPYNTIFRFKEFMYQRLKKQPFSDGIISCA